MPLAESLLRAAEHRMPAAERARLSAFRAEIGAQWTPSTAADVALERRSQRAHLWTCMTVGGVSLLSAGLGGIVTTLGTVVIAVSPPPSDEDLASGVPIWLGLVLAASILSLSIEALRSPRSVQRRFASLVGPTLFVSAVGSAITMSIVLIWDVVLLLSLLAGALGGIVTSVGRLADAGRATRSGLACVGLAALGVAVSDSRWFVIYTSAGHPAYAVGCALSSVGSLLMANGLLFARLDDPAAHVLDA